MASLIVRRLVATVPVLFLVTLGVFLLIHLVPGDPVEAMLGESQDAVAKATLRRELGFDQPPGIHDHDDRTITRSDGADPWSERREDWAARPGCAR